MTLILLAYLGGIAVPSGRASSSSAAGGGALKIEFGGRTSHWQRIGTNTYEQVTGARAGGPYEQLRFYGDDRDPKLSFSSQPHVAYHFVKP